MKKTNILYVCLALIISSCTDGYIDELQNVAPGPDENAPQVTIVYPSSGTVLIPFTDEQTDINFEFEVRDDIEIANITIALNGETLATYDDFLDYRRYRQSFLRENLALGDYTFSVTATDLSGKSTTQTQQFEISNVYVAKYDGEIFYMPFEGDAYFDLLGNITATRVGNPGFAAGKSGRAYAGAANSYITIPTEGLVGEEFSGSFWYRHNGTPANAGLITVSPPDESNNLRTSGFRLFREAAAQILKLNVGTGSGEAWFDGGAANASLNAVSTEWVHIAFSIGSDRATLYINGNSVSSNTFAGMSLQDISSLTIGSGAPNFTGWNHLHDLSYIDELRFFDKALTQEEVTAIYNDN